MKTILELLVMLGMVACLSLKAIEIGNIHKAYYHREIDCLQREKMILQTKLDFERGILNKQ